jgi:hypothetical protein
MDLTSPWGSSTEFRLFGPATYKDGTKGIVSFYPATGKFAWVIKEGGTGPKKISTFSSTTVSPDGTALAFGLVKGQTPKCNPSLVRISVNGGPYMQLVNFSTASVNTINTVLGWRW